MFRTPHSLLAIAVLASTVSLSAQAALHGIKQHRVAGLLP